MRWPWRRRRAAVDLGMLVGFIKVGGTITLEEWVRASPGFRETLVAAAKMVDSERASSIGYAGLSEAHAAEVRQDADQGWLSRHVLLRTAAQNVLTRRRARLDLARMRRQMVSAGGGR